MMHMEVMAITPAQARKWLTPEFNPTNRPLSKNRVYQFAAAMTRGEWRLTHQGIAFRNGLLLDGQHRLAGIAKSGVTVRMVVTNLDDSDDGDAFAVIDTGRARTARDVLSLAGVDRASRVGPACRLLNWYLSDTGTDSAGRLIVTMPQLTHLEILAFLEDHPVMADWVRVAEKTAADVARRGIVSSLLAVMTALDEQTKVPDTLSEFWTKVQTGANLSQDSPILALRRWLQNVHPNSREFQTSAEKAIAVLVACIRAWNAYVEGRSFGRIQVRLNHDGKPAITPETR